MADEERAVDSEKAETKITVEFTVKELFQLHLCVVNRMSFAQQLWACAHDDKSQGGAQNLIEYLAGLETKITEAIKNGAK